jgi:hypothetical protein
MDDFVSNPVVRRIQDKWLFCSQREWIVRDTEGLVEAEEMLTRFEHACVYDWQRKMAEEMRETLNKHKRDVFLRQ